MEKLLNIVPLSARRIRTDALVLRYGVDGAAVTTEKQAHMPSASQ